MPAHAAYLYVDIGQGTDTPPSDPYGWVWHCDDLELFDRVYALLVDDPLTHYTIPSPWTAEEIGDLWVVADEWVEYWASEAKDNPNDAMGQIYERADHIAALLSGPPANEVRDSPQTGGRPGRKKLSPEKEQYRREVLESWERASGAGISREQFCSDWNLEHPDEDDIAPKDIENFQRWKQQRENRGR